MLWSMEMPSGGIPPDGQCCPESRDRIDILSPRHTPGHICLGIENGKRIQSYHFVEDIFLTATYQQKQELSCRMIGYKQVSGLISNSSIPQQYSAIFFKIRLEILVYY